MSWLGLVAMACMLVIYLVTELTRSDTLPVAAISDIGNVTYVASQDESDSDLQLNDPSQPLPDTGEPAFSQLPVPTSELTSEDYVVQSGTRWIRFVPKNTGPRPMPRRSRPSTG